MQRRSVIVIFVVLCCIAYVSCSSESDSSSSSSSGSHESRRRHKTYRDRNYSYRSDHRRRYPDRDHDRDLDRDRDRYLDTDNDLDADRGRYNPSPDRSVDESLRTSMDDFRRKMKNGIPKWDVPPLDPYDAHIIQIVIPKPRGQYYIDEISGKVKGFSKFEILEADIDNYVDGKRFAFEFKIRLPKISLYGNYKMQDRRDRVAEEPISIEIDNLTVKIEGRFEFNRRSLWDIRNIQISSNTPQIDIRMANVDGQEEYSPHLRPRDMQYFKSVMHEHVEETFETYSKIILRDYNPQELQRMLDTNQNFVPVVDTRFNQEVHTIERNITFTNDISFDH